MKPKMPAISKSSQSSQSLSVAQIGHVLELMDVSLLAPKEALRQLDVRVKLGDFSKPQGTAMRVLLSLDHDDAARVLRDWCADDDALELVRNELPYEARMTYVRG